jgi:hypothetical protein
MFSFGRRSSSVARSAPRGRDVVPDPPLSEDERRRFQRIQAPVFFRSPRLRAFRSPVQDISLGGLRVYSDEGFEVGEQLTIELFLPDQSSVSCLVRVAWQRELPEGAPAVYDVGLQLMSAEKDDLARLSLVLARED